MLDPGGFRLFLFDGPVPCNVARRGERAAFDVDSVEGTSTAVLTTTDRAVLEWVESVVDDFRDRPDPVTPDDLVNG